MCGATPDSITERLAAYERVRMNRASAIQILSNAGQDQVDLTHKQAAKYIGSEELVPSECTVSLRSHPSAGPRPSFVEMATQCPSSTDIWAQKPRKNFMSTTSGMMWWRKLGVVLQNSNPRLSFPGNSSNDLGLGFPIDSDYSVRPFCRCLSEVSLEN